MGFESGKNSPKLPGQAGPKAGPDWARRKSWLGQFWPSLAHLLQGIDKKQYILTHSGPQRKSSKSGMSLFLTQKTTRSTGVKHVFSMAQTGIAAPISKRCDTCKKINSHPIWLLRLASARTVLRGVTAGPRHGRFSERRSLLSLSHVLGLALCVSFGHGVSAEGGWTVMGSSWGDAGAAKIDPLASRVSSKSWGAVTSFDERSRPSSPAPNVATWKRPARGSKLIGLRQLISLAESRKDGYNSIHFSATRLPSKRPVDLTIGQIFDWIDKTPGQHHAIGYYQFIPKTLMRLVAKAGLSPRTKFNVETQDLLGDILIAEAGYSEFVAGRKSPSAFMDALARIWAGLPMANGRSAYHGYAGNRASITRTFYEAEMRRIFDLPERAS